MTANISYVPAKHLDYIIRPPAYPTTKGFPLPETDYQDGPTYVSSILSALFDLADPKTGILAPNVSSRLFIYKDLFELYKPFHKLCSWHGSSGASNHHIVSHLKLIGYMPFKTDDPEIPDVWIKAGELRRYKSNPHMVLDILERINDRQPETTVLERLATRASDEERDRLLALRKESDDALLNDLTYPLEERFIRPRHIATVQLRIAKDFERLNTYQTMLEYIS
ncbi:MAG: hypothetical protein HWE12_03635 [Oceanospirillaceae bacterium]|nr:hypothetical protein [Oceanospirillaceae bacterium]